MSFDKKAQYQAYNLASQTVRKTKQIVMLYDGAIRYLKQAQLAINEKRIEDKFNLLNKASEIIVSLQSCLDFDNGGEISHILYDYYSSLDARILNIHRTNNLEMLDSVIANLKQMRESWHSIDESAHNGPASGMQGHTEETPMPSMPSNPTGHSAFTPPAAPMQALAGTGGLLVSV